MSKQLTTKYHYSKTVYWRVYRDYPIQELIDDLISLRDDGMAGVELGYEEDTLHIAPYTQTLETDDEYELRLAGEKLLEERQRENDLRRLKELKEKYEKD